MKCGVFPGQGNQYIGMGKEIYHFEKARQIYDAASEISGIDIKRISFEGTPEEQRDIVNLQLLTFVNSCAWFNLIENNFQELAGHSIGEYAALYASRAFSFEQGLQIVRKRGELMKKVSFEEPSLVLVTNTPRKELEEFCEKTGLEIALYNSPKKYVIGGTPEKIKKFTPFLKGKVIPLKVSGPFHTSMYRDVSEEFAYFLLQLDFQAPETIVYSNYSTAPFTRNNIVKNLALQLCNPVLWEYIIEKARSDEFVEIGPGNSLSRMIKEIRGNATTIHHARDLITMVC